MASPAQLLQLVDTYDSLHQGSGYFSMLQIAAGTQVQDCCSIVIVHPQTDDPLDILFFIKRADQPKLIVIVIALQQPVEPSGVVEPPELDDVEMHPACGVSGRAALRSPPVEIVLRGA